MVSGVVYTFIALLSLIASLACVGFGVYFVSVTISSALMGNFERGSLFFLAAAALGVSSYTFVRLAHRLANSGIVLLDGKDGEYDEYSETEDDWRKEFEEEDELLYIVDDDDEEGDDE